MPRLGESMAADVAPRCCGRYRETQDGPWCPCTGDQESSISRREAKVTIAFTKKLRTSESGLEHSFVKRTDSKYVVCSHCASIVLMAHLSPLRKAATGKSGNMDRFTLVHDVLMIAGVKDKSQCKRGHSTKNVTPQSFYDESDSQFEADDDEDSSDGEEVAPQPRRNPRRVTRHST